MLQVLENIRVLSELNMIDSYQRNYDFAVRVGLEIVGVLQLLAQKPMVVDLTIHSKR